ncbi:MAG: DUF3857 domain-containing transglutaminase family protein [Mesorhizobium sp.]
MRFLAVFLLGLSLSFSSQVSAAEIRIEPIADWVRLVPPAELPEERKPEIRNGIAVLLHDDQVIRRPGGNDSFERTVFRLTDRTGLDAAGRIDVSFNPSKQTAVLHWIRIVRDGVEIDQTRTAAPYIVGQEARAAEGMFTGLVTAYYNLADVRVGDIVDYALTFENRRGVGAGLFSWSFYTNLAIPIGRVRKRLVWPSDEPLHIRNQRSEIQPVVTSEEGWMIREWDIPDPDPIAAEDSAPAGVFERPAVEISSTDDWQDVADALIEHYRLDETLPDSLVADIDDIAARFDEPGERLVEAMRYVQDRYRYVSLSLGAGSHIPRRADVVVASGFGDCKDKSLLLASVLRKLGIEAVVALAHSEGGRALRGRLPSLDVFDHAIVRATIGDAVFWIDATEYLKGGRAETFLQPNLGYALPLVAAGSDLEELPRPDTSSPSATVIEEIAMPTSKGDEMRLRVTSTYERSSADAMRTKVSKVGIASLGDDYLRYYRGLYPGLERKAPLAVRDDRDANIVVVQEDYSLEEALLRADGLIEDFPLRADIGPNLPKPAAGVRNLPVALGQLRYGRHIVRVSNLKAKFIPPKDADILKPYFLLKLLSRSTSDSFELDWHFRTLMEEVAPPMFAKYLKAAEAVPNNLIFRYNLAYDESAAAPVQ